LFAFFPSQPCFANKNKKDYQVEGRTQKVEPAFYDVMIPESGLEAMGFSFTRLEI